VDPERILPGVLMLNVPVGLRGLILVALLAAAMSTFNAIINASTGFLTRDLYQGYIRPRAKNKELISVSYLFGALLMAAGFVMAYSTKNINDIWGWLTMGLVGGIMIPTVLRLYWWRFNGGGFALGTLVGLAATLLHRRERRLRSCSISARPRPSAPQNPSWSMENAYPSRANHSTWARYPPALKSSANINSPWPGLVPGDPIRPKIGPVFRLFRIRWSGRGRLSNLHP
jgi:Na+/proline symporter